MRGAGVLALLAVLTAGQARAQADPHAGHRMPDAAADPHAGHAMPPVDPPADPHAGHAMHAPEAMAPSAPPPAIPTDHAADARFDPAAMARARAAFLRESGGMTFSRLLIDRAEYRPREGRDGYAWEGEGWLGGDIDRLLVKAEGEGTFGRKLEHGAAQALYARAIDPWFNLAAGVRQDFGARPKRTYATVGLEGLAPYYFELEAQAFLSTKGEAFLTLEGSYDQRITQRLILQPAAEASFSARHVPALETGAGLTSIELGLRLRYEIARAFAPYVGLHWERRFGRTADYARAHGEKAGALGVVTGVRFWF